MAEPVDCMLLDFCDASTRPDQVKNVKDSLGSPPQQTDPSQTKIINPIKNPTPELETDYSGKQIIICFCSHAPDHSIEINRRATQQCNISCYF